MTTAADLASPARADLERRLHDASHEAQREFPVVGSGALVTGWDDMHALIDSLLDEWRDEQSSSR